jgi:hypothetical protein
MITKAISGDGTQVLILLGVKKTTANVNRPTSNAAVLGVNWSYLQAENNYPNARHEARHHGIRNKGDVPTKPQNSHQDLNEPADQDGSHDEREELIAPKFPRNSYGCERSNHPGNGDAHRPCRT